MRAPILLRRNRRRRDLTVSRLKCVRVCCACEFSAEKVKPFVLFQTKGAERAGDIFLLRALLKSEAKKKISDDSKKHIKEGEPTTKRKRINNTFASFFLPSFKRTHEHKHAHTHTHTHYLSNNNNNIIVS